MSWLFQCLDDSAWYVFMRQYQYISDCKNFNRDYYNDRMWKPILCDRRVIKRSYYRGHKGFWCLTSDTLILTLILKVKQSKCWFSLFWFCQLWSRVKIFQNILVLNEALLQSITINLGQCTLNLDGLSGKYPPLIIQNDDFMFPTSEEADGTRLLVFGNLLIKVQRFLTMETTGEGEKVDLYCHGSLRNQASTTVVDGHTGVDSGRSRVGLECSGGIFVNTEDQVRRHCNSGVEKKYSFLFWLCSLKDLYSTYFESRKRKQK